ncbi:hypothetical protein FHS29_000098 [Saccharothrix tamanrassetensis]|uniref:Uncharacterized protein n=1 Tax=Saccharothrix tamanrassetensis TaxID=1051531 RepID=A0A841CBI1_9PSEU|nr:hypothetical protein [Saccharothrix tamanrassetensis]MBB5953528.1 hypothetical protein [Saccharothrix tamanrassetensis]
MSRPPGFFEQPVWTGLGLLVVCAGPLALLAGLGGYVPDDDRLGVRPPFTTSHLVAGEEVVEVGTGIPVEVHPTRDLFRLVADPSG